MNKTLSEAAIFVLEQYLHFQVGPASCSVPYFNNKTIKARAALAARVGKGKPSDILDELKDILFRKRISIDSLNSESLKKILVENNLGIDCSGFSYQILNAESEATGKGSLKKHLVLIKANNFIRKIIASLNPVKNVDVATFASDKNSQQISLKEILPGNIITMLGNSGEGERDHILVIHKVEYVGSDPKIIHYSHSIAYPEDGLYGTGVRQGYIEINDSSNSILEGNWSEKHIFARAQRSKTELRKLL